MAAPQELKIKIPSSRRSLILDPIHPTDYLNLKITYACEQCSYFNEDCGTCSIGYDASLHRLKRQDQLYELTGRVAFCRFLEID